MNTRKDEMGFVYIVSNPAMPGLVKIGYTAFNLDKRIEKLSQSTSVPLDFVLEYDMLVEYPARIESLLHAKLASYRVNSRREFFRVSPELADEELRIILFGTATMRIADDIKLLMYLFEKYKNRFASIDKSAMARTLIKLLDVVTVEGWSGEETQSFINQMKLVSEDH